eukprot:TRINITY_DN2866_c0_g1_i1.p1 TRINITY_DN2866_c0_g1~~TRINITY_DN2866_c0_g1_i1.p1  ORF type:complete len:533 (+),score=165.19 TRINITY_DN2866_c0_g1_i1:41-1600(+)
MLPGGGGKGGRGGYLGGQRVMGGHLPMMQQGMGMHGQPIVQQLGLGGYGVHQQQQLQHNLAQQLQMQEHHMQQQQQFRHHHHHHQGQHHHPHHQQQHHHHHHHRQQHHHSHHNHGHKQRVVHESKEARQKQTPAPGQTTPSPPPAASTPTPQVAEASTPVPAQQTELLREEEKVNISEMDVINPLPVARAACFAKKHPLLLTGDSDGTLCILKTDSTSKDACLVHCAGSINDIICTDDVVVVACSALRLYDTAALSSAVDESLAAAGDAESSEKPEKHVLEVQPAFSIALPDKDSIAVSLQLQGDDIVVGDSTGQVWKYRLSKVEGASTLALCEGPYPLHRNNVTGIVFDSTRMITASHDGTVLFTTLKGDDSTCLQLTPCLLEQTCGERGRKRTASGAVKQSAGIVACAVNCIDVDSDGLWLAVGGEVPYVSILCLTTGKVRRVIPLPHHDWKVKSVKFVKAELAVGVDDSYVLTYSLGGKLLSVRQCTSDTVSAVAVSPTHGTWAVTGKNTNVELYP